MTLSARAQAYLAKLTRLPAVPVGEVAAALRRADCIAYPSWLDFHERYAGYVEPLGRESAVLGIVHRDSSWIPPGEASVELEESGVYSVQCAEAHGSFDYRLFEDGSFRSSGAGGPCETFDVKIEQNAVFREALEAEGVQGRRKWLPHYNLGRVSEDALAAFRADTGAVLVPEASDRFAEVWRAPDAIWLASLVTPGALQLWTPENERARITALLASGARGTGAPEG